MLKLLVDNVKRRTPRRVTLADINAVEERMVRERPAFDAQFEVLIFDYSVDEVLVPHEARLGKGLLAVVAKLGHEQQDGWVSEDLIFNALMKHKVPIAKTASLLSQLARTKILEEGSSQGTLRYRIHIPLVSKRFVRQNLHLKYFR
jgi:hypothetical protein